MFFHKSVPEAYKPARERAQQISEIWAVNSPQLWTGDNGFSKSQSGLKRGII